MTPSVKQPIAVGELTVRFLVEAADSNGTVTVFTCFIPAASKMPAPHSHDAFEETVYGRDDLDRGRPDARGRGG